MSTIHPTPSGTRDVLPDEMRELHAIVEALRGVFDAHGYGEVHTPALEYEQVLTRGDPAAAEPAYKLFDEQGNVLVLRSDMTIPIARVVATRYATAEPPLRFCYVAHAYRSVRPQRGQDREMLQAGIELVGVPGARGHRRGADACCARRSTRSASTDYRDRARRRLAVPGAARRARRARRGARARSCTSSQTRDFVGLEREVEGLRLGRGGDRGAARACRSGAAAPRCSTRPARPPTGCARVLRRAAARAVADARDLRPRPRALARLLHGRGLRGLRRGARRAAGRRRALRRPARPLRARPARRRAGRSTSSGCTSRWSASAAGSALDERARTALTLAVPRGALLRDTLDLLDRLGVDTAEVRANDRKLLFEDAGIVTMRPSDVADLRRGRRRRPRHHRQGRARRAVRARGLRAARPRLRAVRDGLRHDRGRGPRSPRRCGASA